jgi:Mor family transcriptional regulator
MISMSKVGSIEQWRPIQGFEELYSHGRAVLTEVQVAEIRNRYAAGGILQRELAKEYSVGQVTISDIIRGKTWTIPPAQVA